MHWPQQSYKLATCVTKLITMMLTWCMKHVTHAQAHAGLVDVSFVELPKTGLPVIEEMAVWIVFALAQE